MDLFGSPQAALLDFLLLTQPAALFDCKKLRVLCALRMTDRGVVLRYSLARGRCFDVPKTNAYRHTNGHAMRTSTKRRRMHNDSNKKNNLEDVQYHFTIVSSLCFVIVLLDKHADYETAI